MAQNTKNERADSIRSVRQKPMSEFVHLHVHSHFSLLDSTVKVADLVERARVLKMPAVAITDHGNLCCAIEFQNAANSAGVTPIFGVALNMRPDNTDDTRPYQLVVLAESLEGYRNLLRLISHSWLHEVDRDGRPITTFDLLREYSAGLIGLSGDLGGEISQALLRGDREKAQRRLANYLDVFGRGNFFIELQRVEGIPEQQTATEALIELARAEDVPVVATNNVHYLGYGDSEAHGVLMCIGMDKRVDRELLQLVPVQDFYLKSADQMKELFRDIPEAIENTVKIAERCDVTIPTGKNFLPDFEVPEDHTIESYLRKQSVDGLERRFAEMERGGHAYDRKEYEARLHEELGIIESMKFPGYFLIVWDFIRWAKDRDIPVGPGRGSGAGSLVAYSLRITDIDPIPYGLLFERFLNPERISMPDFDIDFCQNRRGEVIEYVMNRYGEKNVGMIVTFGQMKAKAALKDVGRVLNYTFAETNRLAKLVPDDLKAKLKDAWGVSEFRDYINGDPDRQFLYDTALKLEGNYRNLGIHAAGVVIAEKPLWEYVPILVGSKGELVTQYAKDEVEEAGLVKFDFLGLKTLTVIDHALKLVNRDRDDDDPLDFRTVDLNDFDTYALIQTGDTAGVFQMESSGFQDIVRRLKPDCFEDIIATVALYRPGPLGSGMVDTYIACKHGREKVSYPHEWLEDVLRETNGVMVYQEQVMRVAQILAGYSLGSADILRRAMGKKKEKEMKQQREIFVAGCEKNDIGSEQANEVFDLMAHFAGYGFNKSHSAAYAMLTFQTAYLKAHHSAEFYAALMTNDAGNTDKVVRYIADARSRGIEVLPPDVNESLENFAVADSAIRFGLGAVKGIGSGPIEAIVHTRESERFTSLFDFCERVPHERCQKSVIEALIRCGAFDSAWSTRDVDSDSLFDIGERRARMLAGMESAIGRGHRKQQDLASGQSSLFGNFAAAAPDVVDETEDFPVVPGWTDRQVLENEREVLGFFVSGHPLDRYQEEVQLYTDATTATLEFREDKAKVRIAGVISQFRVIPIKDGKERMAIATFEDTLGETELVFFSKAYATYAEQLDSSEPFIASGNVRVRDSGDRSTKNIVVNTLQPLAEARQEHVKHVCLDVEPEQLDDEMLDSLVALFGRETGPCGVTLRVRHGVGDLWVDLPRAVGIAVSDELIRSVEKLIGDKRVRLS